MNEKPIVIPPQTGEDFDTLVSRLAAITTEADIRFMLEKKLGLTRPKDPEPSGVPVVTVSQGTINLFYRQPHAPWHQWNCTFQATNEPATYAAERLIQIFKMVMDHNQEIGRAAEVKEMMGMKVPPKTNNDLNAKVLKDSFDSGVAAGASCMRKAIVKAITEGFNNDLEVEISKIPGWDILSATDQIYAGSDDDNRTPA